MDNDKTRKNLLNALNIIEKARHDLAIIRVSQKVPTDIGPQKLDEFKLEQALSKALGYLYEGCKDLYPDWKLARSVDGDVPYWPETEV